MRSYCAYTSTIQDPADVERVYHDKRYGRRVEDDNELFGLLLLEINQAGLSWRMVVMKEQAFFDAYHGFDIPTIAKYADEDVARLLGNASIVRNRLKIRAAIRNAEEIMKIQKEYGSLRKWLDLHANEIGHDQTAWLKLFKKHFTFVGGEIIREFLTGIGMLPGAHEEGCPAYIKKL